MDKNISVALEERTVVRKRLSELRSSGKIPAVVHDHGKESLHVMGDTIEITKAFLVAGKHHPVEVTVAGKKHLALIKDVDIEPVKHRIRHVVFQAIKQNEKTSAEIPIKLVAEDGIPAERKSLIVLKQLDYVTVEALPRDLPDEITVDATTLEEVGDHLTVADLIVPAGVTVMDDPTHQIAAVEMPKDQIAEANASAESLAADAGTPAVEEASAAEVEAAAPKEQQSNLSKKCTGNSGAFLIS